MISEVVIIDGMTVWRHRSFLLGDTYNDVFYNQSHLRFNEM